MKFILAAIIMLILGDMALAQGANTAKVATAIMRFFSSTGEEARSSIFSR